MEAERLDLERPKSIASIAETTTRLADGSSSAPLRSRERQKTGRELNRMALSLNKHVNRVLFKRDEIAYLLRFDLTEEQRRAVINRDGHELQRLGGNLFCILKIVSFDPLPAATPDAGRDFLPQAKFVRDVLARR